MSKPIWLPNPEILKRYKLGESSKSIAKAFNCSATLIINIVRSNGGLVRKAGNPKGMNKGTAKKLTTIERMLLEGRTFTDIGKNLNCSYQAVQQLHSTYLK